MAERVRIAVIGAGAMGANHARVLASLPDAELVAVVDADESRAKAAAYGCRAYADYREMIEKEQLDAVTVAVPTRLHLGVALECIERGLALLVEKPMAADVAECVRLRDAAQAKGVPLMAGHVERFNPAVQELKRRLDAGALGAIHQVRARRVGPFFERERDIGVVQDLATHDIDVARFLLRSEVEQVQAETQCGVRTEFEDALVGLLRFESGAAGVLESNWLTPIKVRELTVLGERGMIELDYLRQELRCYERDSAVRGTEPERMSFPRAGEAPLRNEVASFVRVARREEAPPASADDAIAAMRVVEALLQAAARGEAVRLGAARPAK